MAKYGKWIGGGLGWVLGGGNPIGAILGFAIGSMFDNINLSGTPTTTTQDQQSRRESYRYHTARGDFNASLLVLTAVVMKADGKVMRSEVEYVRNFFGRQFGPQYAQQQLLILKDLLEKDIPLRPVCEEIRYYMEHPLRLQLLHYLFGVAASDGKADTPELRVLEEIARLLAINHRDFESIKAMFVKDTGSAYKILEIAPEANDDDVKKAYRRMAVKYHPDKVGHLGEDHQKAAKEKFQHVQEAYEAIRKERGIN